MSPLLGALFFISLLHSALLRYALCLSTIEYYFTYFYYYVTRTYSARVFIYFFLGRTDRLTVLLPGRRLTAPYRAGDNYVIYLSYDD